MYLILQNGPVIVWPKGLASSAVPKKTLHYAPLSPPHISFLISLCAELVELVELVELAELVELVELVKLAELAKVECLSQL